MMVVQRSSQPASQQTSGARPRSSEEAETASRKRASRATRVRATRSWTEWPMQNARSSFRVGGQSALLMIEAGAAIPCFHARGARRLTKRARADQLHNPKGGRAAAGTMVHRPCAVSRNANRRMGLRAERVFPHRTRFYVWRSRLESGMGREVCCCTRSGCCSCLGLRQRHIEARSLCFEKKRP